MGETNQPTDTRPWWFGAIERFGYPTVMSLVLGWALYAGVSWLGTNVAVPLVEGHLKFMAVTEELGRRQAENMTQVLKTQETLSRQQAELAENNKEIVRTLEALAKKIEKP